MASGYLPECLTWEDIEYAWNHASEPRKAAASEQARELLDEHVEWIGETEE